MRILIIVGIILIPVLALAGVYIIWQAQHGNEQPNTNGAPVVISGNVELVGFSDSAAFRAYVLEARQLASGFALDSRANATDVAPRPSGSEEFQVEEIGGQVGLGSSDASLGGGIDRSSTTNVQVQGIDEPDIVKIGGQQLYVTTEDRYDFGPVPLLEDSVSSSESPIAPPPETIAGKTHVIKAFPADALAELGSIEENGNLLLSGTTLLVLHDRGIQAYDVSTPATPVKGWTLSYDESTRFDSARLSDGTLLLLTTQFVNLDNPCPVMMYSLKAGDVTVPCERILHPVTPIPVEQTYTLARLNANTGVLEDEVSFIGSNSYATFSLFADNAYVAFASYPDYNQILLRFFTEAARDLLPADQLAHLEELETYTLSAEAMLTELTLTMELYAQSLGADERTAYEDAFVDRMQTFLTDHGREFSRTDLVRIQLDDLTVAATGSVPGTVLNQFALDDYAEHLRIATTSNRFGFGSGDSVNDVYVLDRSLAIVGSVLGLGQGEQIYAARFVGERGYLVTFRQTDPFFVLDLSQPAAPKLSGELELPGFSSYLHPLTDTLVLGVGQSGEGRSKLSLFDVSDPSAPTEVSQLELNAFWNEVQNDHHAFLADLERSIVFVPAGNTGTFVSYENGTLASVGTVTLTNVRRAAYINTTYYVVGDRAITAVDGTTWASVGTLSYGT